MTYILIALVGASFNFEYWLLTKIGTLEKRNKMLTEKIDLDYLETLFREKFMVGKKNEKIFVE